MRTQRAVCALAVLLLASAPGCNRNVEDYDPDEKVEAPDLSRIFPPGAERAAQQQPAGAPAGMPQPARGAPPVAGSAGGENEAPLRGTIELAPALEGRVPAGSVLFLIARAAGAAAGPPLAVLRVPDPRFPLDFEIGPENRMLAELPFRGPFQLAARVDTDGNAATRTPGDLSGELPAPVPGGARDLRLVIDRSP